jgi:hypothetical protein
MKKLVCTLVMALTMVSANFALAASNTGSNKATDDTVLQDGRLDMRADSYPLASQLNPRLEFADWQQTSLVCQTQTFWCYMVAPGIVGYSCICPGRYGPVGGVIVGQ